MLGEIVFNRVETIRSGRNDQDRIVETKDERRTWGPGAAGVLNISSGAISL